MNKNKDELFAVDHDFEEGSWLERDEKALRRLCPVFRDVDRNWVKAVVCRVDRRGRTMRADKKLPGKLKVFMNGPKHGDVDVTGAALSVLPETILRLMVDGDGKRSIRNHNHHIELIEGRTTIHFENCWSGCVANISKNGQSFDVVFIESLDTYDEGLAELYGSPMRYTRAQLERELAQQEGEGEAVDLLYYPHRRGKRVIATPQVDIERMKKRQAKALQTGRTLYLGE